MDPVVLAAIISLFAAETAALIGSLSQKRNGKPDDSRVMRLLEEIRDYAREAKWQAEVAAKRADSLALAMENQGKGLGDVANALQSRRTSR